MPALICGSLAFDTITNFPGRFAQQILPEQVHILNVSFLVPTLRREFGGCAGNIAYNLHQLGGEPVVMAALGDDGAEYRARLSGWGADTSLVRTVAGSYTAQAIIITDLDNNQITAFHPARCSLPTRRRCRRTAPTCASASSRPTGATRCCRTPHRCARPASLSSSIPVRGCRCSTATNSSVSSIARDWVAVNDYEGRMLCERSGPTWASCRSAETWMASSSRWAAKAASSGWMVCAHAWPV